MLESNKSARTEPRPTVKRRTVRKSSLIDGGRGETISFGWNDCRRLARRRYCLGPSIRCGAVVPARQLSKYYNLRAGHSVEAKKIVPPNPVLSFELLVTCNLNKQTLCDQRQPIAFVLRTHLLGRFRVRPVNQSLSPSGFISWTGQYSSLSICLLRECFAFGGKFAIMKALEVSNGYERRSNGPFAGQH